MKANNNLQVFKLTREKDLLIVEKEIDDGISYDYYWGYSPTITNSEKKFICSSAESSIKFLNPDSNRRIYVYLCSDKFHYLIGERKVMVSNLNNLRDMGGYLTEDGRLTKFGLLFRSDDLFPLDNKDCLYIEEMKITSIVDYRSEAERNSRPNKQIKGATQYVCSPNAKLAELASSSMETDKERIDKLLEIANSSNSDDYFAQGRTGMEEEMARFVQEPLGIAAFKELISIVKDIKNAPVIQHCRGGKDRTGYGSALILYILGVPEQTIIEDYLLTKKMNEKRNKKRMLEYQQYTSHPRVLKSLEDAMSTQASYLESSINAMNCLSGSPMNYIKEYLGVTSEDISRMKDFYSYSPQKNNI